jgi:hypothetical protein
MSLEIYRALLKEYGKSSACESEKTPALLQQPEVQDGKFSLPKALLGFCLVRFVPAFFRAAVLRTTRSGSFLAPVSRFHSSKVWFEIFPSTKSCANFRLWALLLKGIIPRQ